MNRQIAIAEAELILQQMTKDYLTAEERQADYRIALRTARDLFPGDGAIAGALERDTPSQQRADELLFEQWCVRHGYARDDIARDRQRRPEHLLSWLKEQGVPQ